MYAQCTLCKHRVSLIRILYFKNIRTVLREGLKKAFPPHCLSHEVHIPQQRCQVARAGGQGTIIAL